MLWNDAGATPPAQHVSSWNVVMLTQAKAHISSKLKASTPTYSHVSRGRIKFRFTMNSRILSRCLTNDQNTRTFVRKAWHKVHKTLKVSMTRRDDVTSQTSGLTENICDVMFISTPNTVHLFKLSVTPIVYALHNTMKVLKNDLQWSKKQRNRSHFPPLLRNRKKYKI